MKIIYFFVGAIIGLIKFILWTWWTELLKITVDLIFLAIEEATKFGEKIMKGKDDEINKIN